MESLSTSLILLVLALLLLWLAVTDRLSRVLDAWDVLTAKESAPAGANGSPFSPLVSNPLPMTPVFQLPSLPALGQNVQVGIS